MMTLMQLIEAQKREIQGDMEDFAETPADSRGVTGHSPEQVRAKLRSDSRRLADQRTS
jgi:hypothetical protein